MEVLCSGCQVAHLNVFLGACLEKSLESGAGMLGTLTFVTVRQQEDDRTGPLPFRFAGKHELIDDRLRAVGEIAELRLPQTEHVRIIERISVIESQHVRLDRKSTRL